jgi:HAE1 family hydrophobic/amphiphilic exporter-1
VMPLVFATGAGANARRSLGISVFTGMIASTCLAVVFVPAFFVVLQRLSEGKKQKVSSTAVTPPALRQDRCHDQEADRAKAAAAREV